MNIILESALSHGATSGEFYLLLQNYGIWSRYFGCSGYKAHSSEILPTAIIDDDTAMLVESAVVKLKKSRPNVWRVFRQHYIEGLTPEVITDRLRSETRGKPESPYKRRKNYYEARPAIDTALRHINASGVRSLLKIAENFIYDDLIDYNKH